MHIIMFHILIVTENGFINAVLLGLHKSLAKIHYDWSYHSHFIDKETGSACPCLTALK